MNAFSIIFISVLVILCIVELISLIRSIVKKKNEKKSQIQNLNDFQKLDLDNSNKEDLKNDSNLN